MVKMDFMYTKSTLFITLNGIINKKNISTLKRKMYYIVDEYEIDNIVIDIKNIHTMDYDAFYDFLDNYDIKYQGHLEVVEN